MSKSLAKLLGKTERETSRVISKLEALTGYPSEDIRFHADTKNQLRAKIAEMGLDPADTTNQELYHAALSRFEKDAEAFRQSLGLASDASFSQTAETVAEFMEKQLST